MGTGLVADEGIVIVASHGGGEAVEHDAHRTLVAVAGEAHAEDAAD